MIATPVRDVFRGVALAALSALLLAGCASDDAPRHKHGAMKPITPLAGRETFFDGTITADLNINASPNFEFGDNKAGGRPSGGGMRRHRGGGGGGGMGGPPGGMDGPPSEDGGPRMGMGGGLGMGGRPSGPPVMVHLLVTNNGPQKTEVRITDFLSPVGNFVVQPEKFALESGQSIEAEPMTSRIAGEIPETTITLTLKLGTRVEKKTIALKPAPGSTPPPAPDAPSAAK